MTSVLKASPRMLGFVLKATGNGRRALRRRAMWSDLGTWPELQQEGTTCGRAQAGAQATGCCDVTSEKRGWGFKTWARRRGRDC